MQFNSVINVLYVPYVTVYNKINFSHDKNKPLFDQVKYDEQKSSDDNFEQLNVGLVFFFFNSFDVADMSQYILYNDLL